MRLLSVTRPPRGRPTREILVASDRCPKMSLVHDAEDGALPKQIYVFEAELVDYPDVHRTIAIANTLTLDDLHHALGEAFEWHDEHLYSFWLKGGFWARNGSEYT